MFFLLMLTSLVFWSTDHLFFHINTFHSLVRISCLHFISSNMYVFSIIACHVSHFMSPVLLVSYFEASLPRPVICLKPVGMEVIHIPWISSLAPWELLELSSHLRWKAGWGLSVELFQHSLVCGSRGRGSKSNQEAKGWSSPFRELCPPPTVFSVLKQSVVTIHRGHSSVPAFSSELNVALSGKLSLPGAMYLPASGPSPFPLQGWWEASLPTLRDTIPHEFLSKWSQDWDSSLPCPLP